RRTGTRRERRDFVEGITLLFGESLGGFESNFRNSHSKAFYSDFRRFNQGPAAHVGSRFACPPSLTTSAFQESSNIDVAKARGKDQRAPTSADDCHKPPHVRLQKSFSPQPFYTCSWEDRVRASMQLIRPAA